MRVKVIATVEMDGSKHGAASKVETAVDATLQEMGQIIGAVQIIFPKKLKEKSTD